MLCLVWFVSCSCVTFQFRFLSEKNKTHNGKRRLVLTPEIFMDCNTVLFFALAACVSWNYLARDMEDSCGVLLLQPGLI